jgi:hypothetical protein
MRTSASTSTGGRESPPSPWSCTFARSPPWRPCGDPRAPGWCGRSVVGRPVVSSSTRPGAATIVAQAQATRRGGVAGGWVQACRGDVMRWALGRMLCAVGLVCAADGCKEQAARRREGRQTAVVIGCVLCGRLRWTASCCRICKVLRGAASAACGADEPVFNRQQRTGRSLTGRERSRSQGLTLPMNCRALRVSARGSGARLVKRRDSSSCPPTKCRPGHSGESVAEVGLCRRLWVTGIRMTERRRYHGRLECSAGVLGCMGPRLSLPRTQFASFYAPASPAFGAFRPIHAAPTCIHSVQVAAPQCRPAVPLHTTSLSTAPQQQVLASAAAPPASPPSPLAGPARTAAALH